MKNCIIFIYFHPIIQMVICHLYFSFYPQSGVLLFFCFSVLFHFVFCTDEWLIQIYMYNVFLYQIRIVNFHWHIGSIFFLGILTLTVFKIQSFSSLFLVWYRMGIFLQIFSQICESSHVCLQPRSGFRKTFRKAFPNYNIMFIYLNLIN